MADQIFNMIIHKVKSDIFVDYGNLQHSLNAQIEFIVCY